jgi:hypothetical protein
LKSTVHNKKINKESKGNVIIQDNKYVLNFMGVLSIGTFIGFAYPVSMPLLAGRYLYRNRIM